MSLTKHDPKLALPAFGLRNSGALCYFNSMLQCFLSCTSVMAVYDRTPELRTRNELCAAVWQLITMARAKDPKVAEMSCVIWEALRRQMRLMRITPFGEGMEDAHEGFVKFLDAFNAPEIQELFEHRYRTTFQCSQCQVKWEVENDAGEKQHDTGIFCKFQLEDFQKQTGSALQNMILQRDEPSEDTKCRSCGVKCTHTRTDRFIFTPEVIIPLFAKYGYSKEKKRFCYQAWAADAPEKLVIPGTGADIVYRMMALSEHSGDMEGGHYWAHGQREGERMYRLDDTRVTGPTAVGSSMSSYMVWYHIV